MPLFLSSTDSSLWTLSSSTITVEDSLYIAIVISSSVVMMMAKAARIVCKF